MTEDVRWCIIHRCPGDANRDACFWDLWAGARPGRGACQFVAATVTWRQR